MKYDTNSLPNVQSFWNQCSAVASHRGFAMICGSSCRTATGFWLAAVFRLGVKLAVEGKKI